MDRYSDLWGLKGKHFVCHAFENQFPMERNIDLVITSRISDQSAVDSVFLECFLHSQLQTHITTCLLKTSRALSHDMPKLNMFLHPQHMEPVHPPVLLRTEQHPFLPPGSQPESRDSSVTLSSPPQSVDWKSLFSLLDSSGPFPPLLPPCHCHCLRPHLLCLDHCRNLIIDLPASNQSLQS